MTGFTAFQPYETDFVGASSAKAPGERELFSGSALPSYRKTTGHHTYRPRILGLGQTTPPAQVQAQLDQYMDSPLFALHSLLRVVGGFVGVYHGYRRTGSVGWALWWGFWGGAAPIITTGLALAQGVGKSKRSNRRQRRRANASIRVGAPAASLGGGDRPSLRVGSRVVGEVTADPMNGQYLASILFDSTGKLTARAVRAWGPTQQTAAEAAWALAQSKRSNRGRRHRRSGRRGNR